jgi:hypothetical protein
LWRKVRSQRLDVNVPNRRSVAEAVRIAGGPSASLDAVVAALSFGFWKHLADTSHDRTVWVPYLQRIWPAGTARSQVFQTMSAVNDARNRAAHLEPLFGGTSGRGIIYTQQQLVSLLAMLNPDLAAYVQRTSTVPAILTKRP